MCIAGLIFTRHRRPLHTRNESGPIVNTDMLSDIIINYVASPHFKLNSHPVCFLGFLSKMTN